MRKNKTIQKNKTMITLTAIAVLLVGIGVSFYIYSSQEDISNSATVDYDPPTEEEKASGDAQKEHNVQRQDFEQNYEQEANANPNVRKVATVNLVSASQYSNNFEVRAYVTGVYEDGGKCEAIFEKGSSTVTFETSAFKDATTLQCGALDIPVERFSSALGDWQMKILYTSGSANGTFGPTTVTIK